MSLRLHVPAYVVENRHVDCTAKAIEQNEVRIHEDSALSPRSIAYFGLVSILLLIDNLTKILMGKPSIVEFKSPDLGARIDAE